MKILSSKDLLFFVCNLLSVDNVYVICMLEFWLISMILSSGYLTGVPNSLNVITNFLFLVVGVLCFVLCLQGNLFNIRFDLYDL